MISKPKKAVLFVVGLLLLGALAIVVGRAYLTPVTMTVRTRPTAGTARAALGAVFLAEKSHFAQHGVYSADLTALQFEPGPQEFYAVGFPETCRTQPNQKLNTLESFPEPKRARLSAAFATLPCDVSPSGFTAYVVGALGGAALDIWSIDANENVRQLQNGFTLKLKKTSR